MQPNHETDQASSENKVSYLPAIDPDTFYYYVATPYSRYPGGFEEAYQKACRHTCVLIRAGIPVFCPIAHTHGFAHYGDLPHVDAALWERVDRAFLALAGGLIVVKMTGWQDSKGIAHEIATIEKRGRPIYYWDPADALPEDLIQ